MPMTKINGEPAFNEEIDAVMVFKHTGEIFLHIPEPEDDEEEVGRHILLACALFANLDDHALLEHMINAFLDGNIKTQEEPD